MSHSPASQIVCFSIASAIQEVFALIVVSAISAFYMSTIAATAAAIKNTVGLTLLSLMNNSPGFQVILLVLMNAIQIWAVIFDEVVLRVSETTRSWWAFVPDTKTKMFLSTPRVAFLPNNTPSWP